MRLICLFISFLLLLCGGGAHGQKMSKKKLPSYYTSSPIDSSILKSGGTVYLYENRVDKMKFIGQFVFANLDMSKIDYLKFSIGVEADYYLEKYFSFHAAYYHPLASISRVLMNGNIDKNETTLTRANYMEAGGRFIFRDIRKDKMHRLILETHRSYKTQINYYIEPVLPSRHLQGARIGYYRNATVVNTGMNEDVYTEDRVGAVRATDGAVLTNRYYMNAYMQGGYIGLCDILMFNNVTQNTLKKGRFFRTRFYREIYADLLVGTTTFGSVTDNMGAHNVVANGTNSFQTSRIGGRFGFMYNSEYGRINLGKKLEFGSRPSLQGFGFYAVMSASIAIIR